MVEIKSKTELYAGDANIRKKWRRRTSNEKPEWIVIHYTGDASVNGDADHAARSIIGSSRDSSTHYLIGDRYIINLLPVKYAAYHVGKMDDKKLIPCYNGTQSQWTCANLRKTPLLTAYHAQTGSLRIQSLTTL